MFQALWPVAFVVFGAVNHMTSVCRSVFVKSILDKLLCKFNELENIFYLLCKYILIVTIDVFYHLNILIF